MEKKGLDETRRQGKEMSITVNKSRSERDVRKM